MRKRAAILLVGLVVTLGACGGEAEEPEPSEPTGFEGLSPEQIENQAEPITPEEAERMGIVDTTMRIGAPVGPDSIVPLDSAIVPLDTAAR